MLVGIGLAGLGLSVALAVSLRSHLALRLVALVGGASLAAMVLAGERALVAVWGDRARGTLPVVFGLLLLALVGLGLGTNRWNRETNTVCWHAVYGPGPDGSGDSLELRRSSLGACQERLASPLSILPRLLGNAPDGARNLAEQEFTRIDAGRCPTHVIPNAPCTCGERRWPDATGCPPRKLTPTCAWGSLPPGESERFLCPEW